MVAQDEATSETGETPQNNSKIDNPSSKNNIFDDRPGAKKIIRVVTVMAYLFSVSFVAIALSGYYVFLWQPPNSRMIPRAQTMLQAHLHYLTDVLSDEVTGNVSDKTEFETIFNGVNNSNDGILQHHKINISSDKSFYINRENLNGTKASVNSIIVQMRRNKSDKVTPDNQTDIYDIINDGIDISDKIKNIETSTLFMGTPNDSEILTTTDTSYPLKRIIKKKTNDITDSMNFNHNQRILSDDMKKSSIQSTRSFNNSGFNNENTTQISTKNSTDLLKKFKFIYSPLPIYAEKRKTHSNKMNEKMYTNTSSRIFSSNSNVEEMEINNITNKTNFNQYNLPKR